MKTFQYDELLNKINIKMQEYSSGKGQGNALAVSDRETCLRGREGLRTYAGVAISARDTSVGEMISDHPP